MSRSAMKSCAAGGEGVKAGPRFDGIVPPGSPGRIPQMSDFSADARDRTGGLCTGGLPWALWMTRIRARFDGYYASYFVGAEAADPPPERRARSR